MKELNPQDNVISTAQMLLQITEDYNKALKFNPTEEAGFKLGEEYEELGDMLDEVASWKEYLQRDLIAERDPIYLSMLREEVSRLVPHLDGYREHHKSMEQLETQVLSKQEEYKNLLEKRKREAIEQYERYQELQNLALQDKPLSGDLLLKGKELLKNHPESHRLPKRIIRDLDKLVNEMVEDGIPTKTYLLNSTTKVCKHLKKGWRRHMIATKQADDKWATLYWMSGISTAISNILELTQQHDLKNEYFEDASSEHSDDDEPTPKFEEIQMFAQRSEMFKIHELLQIYDNHNEL